jgi:hypothetical protein
LLDSDADEAAARGVQTHAQLGPDGLLDVTVLVRVLHDVIEDHARSVRRISSDPAPRCDRRR